MLRHVQNSKGCTLSLHERAWWAKRLHKKGGWGGWVPSIFWVRGLDYPLAPKKSYILINLRLKGAWNYAYLAHQIQNFLGQGGSAPSQPPKSWYIRIHFDIKGSDCAFMVPPNTYPLMKRRAAPLGPSKIIYFCKFKLKRTWNYAYLACKIQNFLR